MYVSVYVCKVFFHDLFLSQYLVFGIYGAYILKHLRLYDKWFIYRFKDLVDWSLVQKYLVFKWSGCFCSRSVEIIQFVQNLSART